MILQIKINNCKLITEKPSAVWMTAEGLFYVRIRRIRPMISRTAPRMNSIKPTRLA